MGDGTGVGGEGIGEDRILIFAVDEDNTILYMPINKKKRYFGTIKQVARRNRHNIYVFNSYNIYVFNSYNI